MSTISELRPQHVGAPQLLRVPEVAKLLEVSERTVWRWLKQGALPSVRIGPFASTRVSVEALAAYIAEREEEARSA